MAKLNFGDIATYRKSLGLNQSIFWKRLGVTGLRYTPFARSSCGPLNPRPPLTVWIARSARMN